MDFIHLTDPLTGRPFYVDPTEIVAIHVASLDQRPARSRLDRKTIPLSFIARETVAEVLQKFGRSPDAAAIEASASGDQNGKIILLDADPSRIKN